MTHLITTDFASRSSQNAPACPPSLPCRCWDSSKPHTCQRYRRGSVPRGQPDNVALSRGIYDQVSTNDLLSHFWSSGWSICLNTRSRGGGGGAWEHLLAHCFSVTSPTFWAVLSTLDWHCPGSVLQLECSCKEVRGEGGGRWQCKSPGAAVICGREHSTVESGPAPSAAHHGME